MTDPGAVPGASTSFSGATRRADLWGRYRLDVRGKGVVFARHGSAVIGPLIGANDNRMALAA